MKKQETNFHVIAVIFGSHVQVCSGKKKEQANPRGVVVDFVVATTATFDRDLEED